MGVEMDEYADKRIIEKILKTSKIIAVVGMSDDPAKPSNYVSKYLKENGFEIIPVNPKLEYWEGLKAYSKLEEIKKKVDIVLVFRKPEFVTEIAVSAAAIEAKAIWMQEGVVNSDAAKFAHEKGLNVVMNRCMMKEHQMLI